MYTTHGGAPTGIHDAIVRLDGVVRHHGTIASTEPLTVESTPRQWEYAVSVPLTVAERRAPWHQLPLQVSIRVRVDSGRLGCLIVGDDWTTLCCPRQATVEPGQAAAVLRWEQGSQGAHLVFRNHGADGPCTFTIESIALAPAPADETDGASRLDAVLTRDGGHLDVGTLRATLARPTHDGAAGESRGRESWPMDIVPVDRLHERLGLSVPLDYPSGSLVKPFDRWRMEVDDAPILRYLYRHVRPTRHLEFGTWEGFGTCLCLDECDATVWTINLPEGEFVAGAPAYASPRTTVPAGATHREERDGVQIFQTDAGSFIGHLYRSRGLGHRVNQIFCDSRDWDTSAYPPGFFDSAFVDGGHSIDVVTSDTRKALEVVRPGGLILWHDFCPDPGVFEKMQSVPGVVASLTANWQELRGVVRDIFWIRPSFVLAAIR